MVAIGHQAQILTHPQIGLSQNPETEPCCIIFGETCIKVTKTNLTYCINTVSLEVPTSNTSLSVRYLRMFNHFQKCRVPSAFLWKIEGLGYPIHWFIIISPAFSASSLAISLGPLMGSPLFPNHILNYMGDLHIFPIYPYKIYTNSKKKTHLPKISTPPRARHVGVQLDALRIVDGPRPGRRLLRAVALRADGAEVPGDLRGHGSSSCFVDLHILNTRFPVACIYIYT